MPAADLHRIDLLMAQSRHADLVELAVAAESSLQTDTEIVLSWRRGVGDYHVDPRSSATPHIITQTELTHFKEPVSDVLLHAREEVDRLYAIVRQADYVVLLCNREGVAIQHRGDEAKAGEFKHWGIWLGGVWSEEAEGTNGIGTCIAEQRPVLVHAGQHFRGRHTQLSCAGAPVFDPRGEVVAVGAVARRAREGEQASRPLVLDGVPVAARAIEERLFREFFRHDWIV